MILVTCLTLVCACLIGPLNYSMAAGDIVGTAIQGTIAGMEGLRAASALTVPVNTNLDYNATMEHVRNFFLKGIVTRIAKQLLHQMTISVVNWINRGFDGSPAFLTNPEAFFMDVGDQITGQFISETGVLSRLCTPFNLDVRLSLAIGQSQLLDKRYACTLSTVIDNAMNSRANISVGSSPGGATLGDITSGNILDNTGQLSVNGHSANATADFLNGEFSSGGFPAFIALTSEPQNNPYGAWLMAKSDLDSQIEAKKNAINTDLNRGAGFMSWPKCETIMTLSKGNTQNSFYASDPRYTLKTKADGSTDVQVCTTQTPGSIISSSLENQLGSSVRELEMANDINAIIDALFSQLVTKVLSGGLASASGGSGGISFTSQLQSNVNSMIQEQTVYSQTQTSDMVSQALSSLSQYKAVYDQALTLIIDSMQRYQTAKSCFVNKTSSTTSLRTFESSYAQSQISLIDSVINQQIQPYLGQITAKRAAIDTRITNVKNLQSVTAGQTGNIQSQVDSYSKLTESVISENAMAIDNMAKAQQDLADVQTKINSWNTDAAKYQSSCDRFPTSAWNFGR